MRICLTDLTQFWHDACYLEIVRKLLVSKIIINQQPKNKINLTNTTTYKHL